MLNSDLDLASLKTVSSFDQGVSSTMAVGIPSTKPFTPASLLIESLIEQLCKLIDKDPRQQRKLYLNICSTLHQMHLIDPSYDMEEFQFMRSHYQKALYKLMKVTHQTTSDEFVPHPHSHLNYVPGMFEISRYITEFRELAFIAKGGFGNVFKVQHKLDGGIYAVKKICLRYRSRGFLRNLNEVKMLARLFHPNIVAYKAAWLENIIRSQLAPVKGIAEASSHMTSSSSSSRKSQNGTSNSLEVVFQDHSENGSLEKLESSNTSMSNGHFGAACVSLRESKITSVKERNDEYSLAGECMAIERCHRVLLDNSNRWDDKFRMSFSGESEWAMLYIQMQLCHDTLRNWLDNRNHSGKPIDADTSLRIFKQITTGIEYIHSQKIVHHDIKPSNIFVSEDLREVQVGDFGLACHFLSHGSSQSVVEFIPHTPGRVGTELYAAPEQLQGICNPKSDVFSLGIVLLELIQPFQTLMERSKVISQVKSGKIPTETSTSFPHLTKIISKTVSGHYKQRPSSSELLASLSDTETEAMHIKVKHQEETIVALRRESAEKDELISFLQNQLKYLMLRDNS